MPENSNHVALELRVASLEEDRKRNFEAHREFYTRLQASEQSQAIAQERHLQIISRFDTLTRALEELSNVPVKRWHGLTDKVIFTVVGLIVAFLMTKLGV